MTANQSGEEVTVTGLNSILPKENDRPFYNLQILQHLDKDVCAIASWDSSIHDSPNINKVTECKQNAPFPHFPKIIRYFF